VRTMGREVSLSHVQISSAHAADADAHANLPRSGFGSRPILEDERTVVDRAGNVDCPGLHEVQLCTHGGCQLRVCRVTAGSATC
jgi:hypothetical protein